MKRLLLVTALAAMTVGLAGCGRNGGQRWNRGAWCAPQAHTSYAPYDPVEVYDDGAVITQPAPPATLPPLPGPAR
jgi:predicted small lipoprotein YifL